jgi:excisionase family DNA binding protein
LTLAAWLHDPDRVLVGTTQAIERARARGVAWVEPDDLLAGMLLAISRFGMVDLGERMIDLSELEPRFDLPGADVSVRPRYTPAAAAAFERAARVARADGEVRLAPIHLLVALGDHSIPTFARIAVRHGIDPTGWRRLLSCIAPPLRPHEPMRPAPPPAPLVGLEALVPQDEAARALGVSIEVLRGYVRSGKLPAFRVPGDHLTVRIRREDLAALLALLQALDRPMQARSRPHNSAPVESGPGEPITG